MLGNCQSISPVRRRSRLGWLLLVLNAAFASDRHQRRSDRSAHAIVTVGLARRTPLRNAISALNKYGAVYCCASVQHLYEQFRSRIEVTVGWNSMLSVLCDFRAPIRRAFVTTGSFYRALHVNACRARFLPYCRGKSVRLSVRHTLVLQKKTTAAD